MEDNLKLLNKQLEKTDKLKDVILSKKLSEKEKLNEINKFESNLGFMYKFAKMINEKRQGPIFTKNVDKTK